MFDVVTSMMSNNNNYQSLHLQGYDKYRGVCSLPSERKMKKESDWRQHSQSNRDRSPHCHTQHRIHSWSRKREKFRHRIGSPDRRPKRSRSRSKNRRRRRSRSRDSREKSVFRYQDIDLREQGTRNFDIKSVKPFAVGVASRRADNELGKESPQPRTHSGEGRVRGQVRGKGHGRSRSSRRGGPVTPKKKFAIGRNVFNDSDSQEDDQVDSKGDRKDLSFKEPVRVYGSDDRPGLKHNENNRWKRWQGLSRKKPGEEDDEIEIIAKFPNPEPSPETEDRSEPTPSPGLSTVPSTSLQPQHAGVKVTVKTFKNEEVGILSGSSHVTILFHVNQVWVSHPSIGYCSFREIYPISELSQHLYPGLSVLCWARQISQTRDCNYQATVVWLEGVPPSESLYR